MSKITQKQTALPDPWAIVVPPPMSDSKMLETLARWFDVKYPDKDREVQLDLQRIARRLRALDGR